MGTTLTGTTPQDTYDSLIKVTDNGPLGPTTAKYLSDGLGNDSVLALSQAAVGIGTTNPLNPLFVSVGNAGDYAAFVENTNSSNGYGLVARTAHTGASAYAFAARAAATDIFVVRADGHVGIGTGAPASTLDVSGTLEVSSTGVFVGDLRTNGNFSVGNTTLAGTKVAQIYPSATSTPAIIQGVHAGVGPYDLALQTSGGNVGIGTDAPVYKFEVSDGTRTAVVNPNSAIDGVFIGVTQAKPLAFGTSDTEQMRITSTGVLELTQGQIKFPATQVASADANTLDDYEEGAWTPTDASGAGLTLPTAVGSYTKIGREVFYRAFIDYPSTADGNNANIGGLPFTVANANEARSGNVTYTDESTLTYALNTNNNTTVGLYTSSGGFISNATMSGNTLFIVGNYYV